MKDKIIELNIDPAIEYSNVKKAIEPEKWQKDWEENCLCNTCKNSCIDTNCIVNACSSYKEVEGRGANYE